MAPRIAIFGGAFDPPHVGHASMISQALNSGLVDEVWAVPSGTRDDKESRATPQQRCEMVELMVREAFPRDKRVRVDRCEAEGRVQEKGTVGLLSYLTARNPSAALYVMIGAELIGDLPRWKEPERLRREAVFMVIERGGYAPAPAQPGYTLIGLPSRGNVSINLSSSTLRSLLRERAAVGGMLLPGVERYLRDQGLY